jgi:hypothetical protein
VIETPAEPMVKRLSPVRCGRCNTPVAVMNKQAPGSEAGGLCTRCTKDEQGRIRVYTYVAIIEPSDKDRAS